MTDYKPDASLYTPEQIAGYKRDNDRRLKDAARSGDARINALPAKVTLELTADCDLFCKMCEFVVPRERGRKKGYGMNMTLEHFEMLAPQVFPSAKVVNLTVVGEPLLVPYLDRVLEQCEQWQTKLEFITHAVHMDQAMIEKVGPNTACLIISFDGGTRETFNRIRVGSDFNRVTRNGLLFSRWRAGLPEGAQRPGFHLGVTLMKDNIHELPTIIRIAHLLGVDRVNAALMIAFSEKMARNSLFNHKALSNAWVQKAREVADELGVSAGLPTPFPGVSDEELAAIDVSEPHLPDGPLPHLLGMLAGGEAVEILDDQALPPEAGGHDIDGEGHDDDIVLTAEGGPPQVVDFGMDALTEEEALAASAAASESRVSQTTEEKRLQAQTMASPPEDFSPIEPDLSERGSGYTCKFLWNELFVSLSGDVAPCCIQGRPVVGNVHQQDLGSIWNGEPMQEMRRRLWEGDPVPCCKDCNYMTQLGFGSYREDTFFIDRTREV